MTILYSKQSKMLLFIKQITKDLPKLKVELLMNLQIFYVRVSYSFALTDNSEQLFAF